MEKHKILLQIPVKNMNLNVNRNHKDYEGVTQIELHDTEIYTQENDYPVNGRCGIYLKEEDDEE